MYTDDDTVAFDALSDTEMAELAQILQESGYPGGIAALAAEARDYIASCVGGAVWSNLTLAEAEGLTDAEALCGIERQFSEFGEPGSRLNGFIASYGITPARRFYVRF